MTGQNNPNKGLTHFRMLRPKHNPIKYVITKQYYYGVWEYPVWKWCSEDREYLKVSVDYRCIEDAEKWIATDVEDNKIKTQVAPFLKYDAEGNKYAE